MRDEQSDGTCLRRERSTYWAVRQLTLPSDVKGDQMSASFLNGVLSMRVFRVMALAPRRIPIGGAARAAQPQVSEAGYAQA